MIEKQGALLQSQSQKRFKEILEEHGADSMPYPCPICKGTTLVPKGFYDRVIKAGEVYLSKVEFKGEDTEKCIACKNGVVWSPVDVEVRLNLKVAYITKKHAQKVVKKTTRKKTKHKKVK